MTTTRHGANAWPLLIAIVALAACADRTDRAAIDQTETVVAGFVDDATGATREVDIVIDHGRLRSARTAEVDETTCGEIQTCADAFGSAVCRTNSACSSEAQLFDCQAAAEEACGENQRIRFDAPIPCPIAGVSSCDPGESLVYHGEWC